MSLVQILALLLALSVAAHIGAAGAFLVGASVTGTGLALYLTAVGVYR